MSAGNFYWKDVTQNKSQNWIERSPNDQILMDEWIFMNGMNKYQTVCWSPSFGDLANAIFNCVVLVWLDTQGEKQQPISKDMYEISNGIWKVLNTFHPVLQSKSMLPTILSYNRVLTGCCGQGTEIWRSL